MKRTFRVKRTYPQQLRQRKARIERRLGPKHWSAQAQPMLRGGNLRYEMAERAGAVGCGGLGAIHTMAQRLGLVDDLDAHLHLLKPVFYSFKRWPLDFEGLAKTPRGLGTTFPMLEPRS
jgi:hypothetical protein